MDENPDRSPEALADPAAAETPAGWPRPAILAAKYDRPIKFAVVEQLIFGLLAALMLDGGRSGKRIALAMAAYWLCFSLIAYRRPMNPTAVDLAIVKWSFPFLAMMAFFLR